ncbi:CHAD domain-containing protein [Streptomyces syringium]|uniref:CYTH and CHAD domain-containing protein n=1 Tax=Streptomyces syringium TaxID=76729 RepID=UPI0036A0D0C6
MAETVREIERKYEAGDSADAHPLPDLSGVAGVASVAGREPAELDAVYYDTADRRLAAAGITLRRRTGGTDAGWHLKLPVAPGTRDEIRAPLSPDVPRTLAALVRSRTRHARLTPLVRIVSRREVHLLLDEHGGVLAEVSADEVTAERLADGGRTAHWTEFELELGKDTDPGFLDTVEPHLRAAGLRPSKAPSKLSRALTETDPEPARPGKRKRRRAEPGKPTAGEHVLAYVRAQAEAVVTGDLDVRRDVDDSVHQMRVATRRLRSAFRTFGKVLDREITDPIGDELKWLAGELGVDRDREVLSARLRARVDEVPDTLVLGPVRARLRRWAAARHAGARKHLVSVLDSERYLTLLDTLDALLADPPLLPAAADTPRRTIAKAVLRDYRRLARRLENALATEAGPARDTALHEARKAAKRVRYAAEAAKPALGKPAKRFARRMKSVQSLLGEHQDSVMAREALRALAIQAHAAGESTYTLGLLHGREEALAAAYERELPDVWEKASAKRHRTALRG